MHWSYDFLKIRKTITILAQCKWEKFNGEFILVVSVTWNDQCYCYSPAFCSGFSWACWIVRFWENLLCPCLLKSFVTCIELWEKFKIYLSDFYLRLWRNQWWWVWKACGECNLSLKFSNCLWMKTICNGAFSGLLHHTSRATFVGASAF